MYDLIVIGGGPAGMAAALAAHQKGIENILIVERGEKLGGILNQCIHTGFGIEYFGEELTGPEYAERFIKMVEESPIEVMTDTMVLNITEDKIVTMSGSKTGYRKEAAKAIILAMGCRERARGALQIPGNRPAGVFTAGTAQRYVNIDGYLPGKRIVILGSGDIGLIMARRLTLEGAKVLACVEIKPKSGGLRRNIVQCLDDFGIPLLLSHTITEIRGKDRVNQVVIARVDGNMEPIPGTEEVLECDTVLLSCGLIPENELSKGLGLEMNKKTGGPETNADMETSIKGIFACGNVAHVHDIVDNVTKEAIKAGKAAACHIISTGAFCEAPKYACSEMPEGAFCEDFVSSKMPKTVTE